MKRAILSWALWIGGSALVIGLDYATRLRAPSLYGSGLSPIIQFLLYALFGAVAAWQMVLATRPFASGRLRALLIGVQIPLALGITYFANLFYLVRAGIDAP